LAVLYCHAEQNGGAITPEDVFRLFDVQVSLRRVELALGELQARGDVDREYHPHYSDEGLWQISRNGMAKVDRALRVPTSFLARLHESGDQWLESDEARDAVLKKLSEAPAADVVPVPQPAVILPVMEKSEPEPRSAIDWTKWGTILAAVGIAVTIMLWSLS